MALILAILIFAPALHAQNDTLTLVRNHTSEYTIFVPSGADSLTQRAAREIQSYLLQITGTRLEISNQSEPARKEIQIGPNQLKDSGLRQQINQLKEDGFIITTSGSNLILSGKDGKSNLYAAYTFIEEFLGCRLLSTDAEYIPQTDVVQLPAIRKVYEPEFAFRRILFPGMFDEKYRYWHKLETLDDWGMFVHTFQHLVPPEKYFETHPEYFSLIGGRRLKDAQLCLSNPELIQLLIENLGKKIAEHPEKTYWSVSQNDCYNYCLCDACQALYDAYGSFSGAYIFMANEIARAFPDKQISTLAYQFTRSAPTNIQPLENVNIMFCSIECNRSMPLADDPRSAGFVKDMEDWARLSSNIFVWDYVVQFKNYLTPFPNFDVLQPNIQFFAQNKVGMMFQQGSSRNWSDLCELKQYLIAKLLWNPSLDVDALTDEFLSLYYGPAKPHIQAYFDLSHSSLEAHQKEEFLNIYGFPLDYTDSYLTPELLRQYKQQMDAAEVAVQGDSRYLSRVLRTRLPVDFAYLDIALNKPSGEITYLNQQNGSAPQLRQDMLNYLDRFVENSIQTGATRINERNLSTEAYREYARIKLQRMTQVNLAAGKPIQLLTQASEKYPVGGVKALTDGLLGDLDYHNNWLGFEGEDMLLELDLEEAKTISQIKMNFLKAVNSWVFLPVEVRVEASLDGKNFHLLGALAGDVDDKNYLVKSIPFNLDFEAQSLRFIRIKATSLKECPEWHRGFGKPSWIFIDELIVGN
ncbi:MAG: DUF4838 domain-containing protein [Saprospiraceae bacterium]